MELFMLYWLSCCGCLSLPGYYVQCLSTVVCCCLGFKGCDRSFRWHSTDTGVLIAVRMMMAGKLYHGSEGKMAEWRPEEYKSYNVKGCFGGHRGYSKGSKDKLC
ncbi:hypothetical protein GWK47_043998 [Chionoecetes opilio]|uniref:Secreted protein n=1 Tax=Chionoecetes opilio TaxID=41210 RepID=A0A8J4Y786_CHIOP|nr:hypothetical protein GWK47_043998 [Chionoecetes opilio]